MWKRLPDEKLKRLRDTLKPLSDKELRDLKQELTDLIRGKDGFLYKDFEVITIPAKKVAATERRKGFVRKAYQKVLGFEVESGSVLEEKILALFTPEVRTRLGMLDGKVLTQDALEGVELRALTSKKRPGIKGQKGKSVQLTCLDVEDKTKVYVWKVKLPTDPSQGIFKNPRALQPR